MNEYTCIGLVQELFVHVLKRTYLKDYSRNIIIELTVQKHLPYYMNFVNTVIM